jgi:hypothetical protein
MRKFESGELTVAIDVGSKVLKLTWLGQSNTRDPHAMLAPLLEEIRPLLNRERDVELDFREFEYMNSSTFRPILGLVQVAATGSRGVNVRYNTQKNWQRLSFKTLEAVTAVLGNVRFAS